VLELTVFSSFVLVPSQCSHNLKLSHLCPYHLEHCCKYKGLLATVHREIILAGGTSAPLSPTTMIQQLPNETLLRVAHFLSKTDIFAMSLSTKHFSFLRCILFSFIALPLQTTSAVNPNDCCKCYANVLCPSHFPESLPASYTRTLKIDTNLDAYPHFSAVMQSLVALFSHPNPAISNLSRLIVDEHVPLSLLVQPHSCNVDMFSLCWKADRLRLSHTFCLPLYACSMFDPSCNITQQSW
jgi:hypothetical protein